MKRFLLLSSLMLFFNPLFAQNTNLSDYSYVIVPDQYDFLRGKDQWQINSMTRFYLEKNGFNAYMADQAPNANRCDGLYADVEELWSLFGTKLQVVLRDCNNTEIYRGVEGKSKYKEFDKSYQDALRQAFTGFAALRVNQKDVILLNDGTASASNQTNRQQVIKESSRPIKESGDMLPAAKFSNYSSSGKTYLLRKTTEGYSLYEESIGAADGLLLKGSILVADGIIKFIDSDGKVSKATFDSSGNLTVKDDSTTTVYILQN